MRQHALAAGVASHRTWIEAFATRRQDLLNGVASVAGVTGALQNPDLTIILCSMKQQILSVMSLWTLNSLYTTFHCK